MEKDPNFGSRHKSWTEAEKHDSSGSPARGTPPRSPAPLRGAIAGSLLQIEEERETHRVSSFDWGRRLGEKRGEGRRDARDEQCRM
jgi:hypothetical protein